MVFEGHGPPVHLGSRVQGRPLANGHGDAAQLLTGGAELVHVPGCKEAVVAHRPQVAEWLTPVAFLLLAPGAGVASLGPLLTGSAGAGPAIGADSHHNVVGDAKLQVSGRRHDPLRCNAAAAAGLGVELDGQA